jgi:spore germination protein GerM
MKRVLLTVLALLMLGAGAPASNAQGRRVAGRPAAGRRVQVYLVALDDNGKRGRRVGCNDSLVPVTRTVGRGADPLRAAVEELLAIPREYEGGLGNFWQGENLSVQSVAQRGGVATIRLRGNVQVAGACDAPRIEGQIRETARQFRGVRTVRVFVGGRRLADVLR